MPSNTRKVVGAKILEVRPMTEGEIRAFSWFPPAYGPAPLVMQLDNDVLLIPSQDPEGNGPGSLFLVPPDDDLEILRA